jgi:hypothetical protein
MKAINGWLPTDGPSKVKAFLVAQFDPCQLQEQ